MMWPQQTPKKILNGIAALMLGCKQTLLNFSAQVAARFAGRFSNQLATKRSHISSAIASERLDPAFSLKFSTGQALRAQGVWNGGWEADACESSYWAASSASADMLWQMVTNLADLSSWHPLITSTNAPRGQCAKPGLIYRAVMPYLPVSTQIFVERVLPGELLSIRLFPLPGLQERVTYRIVSTLRGTCVLYSITLSGWLSPLAWPMVKPHATQVAAALVEAAEQHMMGVPIAKSVHKMGKTDIFGSPV